MKNRTGTLVICLLLAAVTLAAYWPVFRNGFIGYDDGCYITENAHVRQGLTWDSVRWAFSPGPAVITGNWHPLTWLSHMLDCQLYGVNPTYHHLTNLLLHIANVLLLFLLLSAITGATWPSAFVAALFALHPLHVESVAWAAERKDVLSTLFWLLTMLAYARYARQPDAKRYALVIALFVLGLLAKPMLVMLPLVLLLIDYWPLRRFEPVKTKKGEVPRWRRLVIEKIPMVVIAAAASAVAVFAQRSSNAMKLLSNVRLPVRIDNAAVAYIEYLVKMVYPRSLAIPYPHPMNTLPVWQVAGSIAALALGLVLAVRVRKPRPYVFVGVLWYLVTLIPVIGLVQVGVQALADRYTYVPLIGIFIAISWGAADLLARQALALKAGLAALVLLALAGLSYQQVGVWKDNVSLFEHSIACTQRNRTAEMNLAGELMRRGDIDGATKHVEACLLINPGDAEARTDLSLILHRQGHVREAIEGLRTAIRLSGHQPMVDNALAWLLLTAADTRYRNPAEALRLAESACRREADPTYLDTLAAAYAAAGRYDEAASTEQRAIRIGESSGVVTDLSEYRGSLRSYEKHKQQPGK